VQARCADENIAGVEAAGENMHMCIMRLAFDRARRHVPDAQPYILVLVQEQQVLAAAARP